MRTLLIILSQIIFIYNLIGQNNKPIDTLNQTDNQKNRIGFWKELINKDSIDFALVNYEKGKKNGLILVYHNNGNIIIKGTFKNNQKEGVFYEYYSNGSLKSITNYHKNKIDGLFYLYWGNGNIKEIKKYRNNKTIHGIYQSFHINGIIEYSTERVSRFSCRIKVTEYNSDGLLVGTGFKRFGKNVGHFKYYDKNGMIIRIEKY